MTGFTRALLMIAALVVPTAEGLAQDHGAPAATRRPAPGQVAPQTPFLVLYRRGPTYNPDRTLFEQASIREHIRHHEALGERLIAAGPLRGAPDGIVGAIVVMAPDLAAAQGWLASDPGVTSGVLSGTVAPWSTSAIRAYRRVPSR